ncbi:MAG: hypothetical protein DCC67_05600 [Planctomycetota bacterium]|nr:MAG: hypothetical protein DCC67_05600 [Planctomycetota bacterium]
MRRSLEVFCGFLQRYGAAHGRRQGPRAGRRRAAHRAVRRFSFESLEPRVALAAAGLTPIGAQPTGPLTGKIVYTSAGHGFEWVNGLGWRTGRGDSLEIEEAFGNQDQMTYYVDYLWRAGATIVPMRPVGRQIHEVVLDNDSAGVAYSGAWSDSTAGNRWYDEDYGAVADAVRYRFASTSAAETAVATYTPTIPQAGFYPVYAWAAFGGNRTSQLYKVNHTGGQTHVRVDHSKVGNGWVYLGTYHFNSGASAQLGSVQISNEGAAGKVVIADAIRFGNGMGDVRDSDAGIGTGGVSGSPREDENALMWLWRAVGQGVAPESIIGTSNVSAPTLMAAHMNADANPFGTSVYIGFHSNAAGGRGAVGLIDVDAGEQTPHQADLALYTGRQINQDMQALNGQFEHNWGTRTTHTYSGEFGEINEGPSAEFDATIIEVAFHDQTQDAQLLRDPKVRDQLGRSTYEATLEYFDHWGGLTSPVALPAPPTHVSVVSNASGEVTLQWTAGPTGVRGGAATGFRIYASTDGYGFDGGTYVAGGGVHTATLSGYDPLLPYYFKVVAVNAGGESRGSEVVTALPSGGAKQVLIVNGFDRFDRTQNFRYPYAYTGDGLVDRVWSRYNNSFDYVVQVHTAIYATKPGVHVASASNEAIASGSVNLGDYDAVVWILGNESTADDTFSAAEQSLVEQFVAAGGDLFVSGAEIGWDLDQQNNGRTFFETTLKGDYVADDAGTYTVSAAAGGIFAGLPNIVFSSGPQFSSLTSQVYNVAFPDVISPQAGAQLALAYSGGVGGAAIDVPGQAGRGNVVMFGFPFETITAAANRSAVMGRVLDFFGVAPVGPISADFDDDGLVDAADFLAWQRGFGMANPGAADGDADHNDAVDHADLEIWASQFGTPAGGSFAAEASIAALTASEALDPAAGWLAMPAQAAGQREVPATAADVNAANFSAVATESATAAVQAAPSTMAALSPWRRPRPAEPVTSAVDAALERLAPQWRLPRAF